MDKSTETAADSHEVKYRLKVLLRTLTLIETCFASRDVIDRFQEAIEASKSSRWFRKKFHTFKIKGSPRDIVFRLDDVVTISIEEIEVRDAIS